MSGRLTDNLPRGASNEHLQLVPSKEALATTVDASISSATTVSLNADTSLIEVNALAQGVYLKYGTGASSSDFDEYIQAGLTRHYVVPNGVTQISVIEQASGATVVIIEK
jgi:hypothetical protein